MPQLCHALVRKTAIEFAQALYEALATNNKWYAANKDRAAFVNSRWPLLLPKARATLAEMLKRPIDERLKAEIREALILDHGIRRNRVLRVQ